MGLKGFLFPSTSRVLSLSIHEVEIFRFFFYALAWKINCGFPFFFECFPLVSKWASWKIFTQANHRDFRWNFMTQNGIKSKVLKNVLKPFFLKLPESQFNVGCVIGQLVKIRIVCYLNLSNLSCAEKTYFLNLHVVCTPRKWW